MCQQAPETVDHFLVECNVLEEKRRPIMDSIFSLVNELFESALASEELVQILLDCSKLVDCQNDRSVLPTVNNCQNACAIYYTLNQGRRRRYGRSGHGWTTFLAKNGFGRTIFLADYDFFFAASFFRLTLTF